MCKKSKWNVWGSSEVNIGRSANRRVPVCQNFSLTDAFRQTEKARFGSDVPLCRTRLFRQTRKWMFGIEPPVCRKRTWTDSSDKLVKRYSGRQFLFDGKNISGRLWKLITRRPPELNGKDTWHSTGKLSSEDQWLCSETTIALLGYRWRIVASCARKRSTVMLGNDYRSARMWMNVLLQIMLGKYHLFLLPVILR